MGDEVSKRDFSGSGMPKKDSHKKDQLNAKAENQLKSGHADPHMEEKTTKRTGRAANE